MTKKILYFVLLCLVSQNIFAQNNFNSNVKLRNHTTFTGQTLANICGYWQNGREYALLGASKGMIIMDVTNPDSAKQIAQLPGPNNLWKEIKVYKHYAYVTSEGGQGLQIVDMAALPSKNLTNVFYTGDGAIAGKLNKIHALHIDTLKGVVYCFGATGVSNSGATMLDIKTDPMKPKYLGSVDKDYIHDGYAHNDTLYAGHIYRGEMEIWYTGDKSKAVSLGKIKTPTKFTHNIWLSENHKYAYTTDENEGSYLACYDVSDPTNIMLVDKIQTNPGTVACVHNTHIINDFAVSSYYTEGFTIVDAHRPDNLVQVARYDTYLPALDPADIFKGAWGVYPYLPSGTIIVSNIDEGLFVLTPTYKRAAYLEGTVKSKTTGELLSNVQVAINGYATADALSSLKGEYKTGVVDSGKVNVTFIKSGYKVLNTSALVKNGKVTILDVVLEPFNQYSLTVKVIDANTNKAIPDATVAFSSTNQNFSGKTDTTGQAAFTTFADTCILYAGKWGYSLAEEKNVFFNGNLTKVYKLKKGYRDDFVSALKHEWKNTATASIGNWVLSEPISTQYQGQLATPDEDNTKDVGTECYLTGNEAGSPAVSDVDNGDVTLTSPNMDLSTYTAPALSFDYWFYNGGGAGTAVNDSLYLSINDGKKTTKILVAKGTSANKWNIFYKTFKELGIIPTATMTVSFIAVDGDPGHIVKAAIDKFEVVQGASVNVADINENIKVLASPNPFGNMLSVDYQLDGVEKSFLIVTDIAGKIVEKQTLTAQKATVLVGEKLNTGLYFVQIQQGSKNSTPLKVVKM
jgi:choice-of-anchor B domain-containing protein